MGLAKGLELGSVVDSLWGRCHRRLLLRGRQEAQRQGEETVEGSRGHTGAVRGFEGEGTPGHGACGRQGLHSPLESLGGAEHCPHLRLQLLTARAVRVDFSCFITTFVPICYSSFGKLIHGVRSGPSGGVFTVESRNQEVVGMEHGGGGWGQGQDPVGPTLQGVIRPRRFLSLYSGNS